VRVRPAAGATRSQRCASKPGIFAMQATDGASEAREGIVALDFQLSQTANSGDMHRLEQLLIKDPAVVVKAMTKSAGKLNVVHKAAARGHAHVLRRLLEVGGRHDVALPNGDRAIHLAVRAGQPTTLKVLLDRGADYSCKNSAGNSPLYEAVVGRQSHCFLHLVQSGADYHSYIQQGKITEHDIKNLQRGLHGMSAEQQSLLFSTLGHIGAEWEISDSDVRSDADRHREKFMREQEYQVKELEMQQTAQAAAAASLASVSPRTNPMDVCASLIAESKSARSDLRCAPSKLPSQTHDRTVEGPPRIVSVQLTGYQLHLVAWLLALTCLRLHVCSRSLEDRCQSSNIVEQAFMLRNEKAEHDAAEKAKSRAMANGISGVRAQTRRTAARALLCTRLRCRLPPTPLLLISFFYKCSHQYW
jgi:hypothetical protein